MTEQQRKDLLQKVEKYYKMGNIDLDTFLPLVELIKSAGDTEWQKTVKPLVDEGYCYVITENKGGFYKGDYFEGKARNVLHHVRTAFEFAVNEEIMKDFVKLGLWTPEMGLQMNDVAMQELNGVVTPITYNFRGEIED